jgi:hypothetical protein
MALSDLTNALNSFNSAVVAAMGRKYPSGAVPVSAYGNATGSDIAVTFDTTNHLTNFAAGTQCLIAGQVLKLSAYSLPYTVNGTMYYYVQLNSGVVSIVASASVIVESNTNMYIGKVVSNSSGVITSNTIVRAVRLDVYRVSPTSAGSAISVSGGTPDASSSLNWT